MYLAPAMHSMAVTSYGEVHHPGVELRANLKSISHKLHLFEVAFVWELTKETILLPLGCLLGGKSQDCLILLQMGRIVVQLLKCRFRSVVPARAMHSMFATFRSIYVYA